MKRYDYLIVGAGLFGSVFAHMATESGKRCLVIDKRSHLGGNVYCEDWDGIPVHMYGAHIFHTSNLETWRFVNKFVDFRPYVNSPLANYKGKLYNLPFNMNTFYQLWGTTTPQDAKKELDRQVLQEKRRLNGRTPLNLEEQALSMVGKDIYEKLIKGYTEKQWGRSCEELPASIIKRLPVRFTFDNNYFMDTYQGIPAGGYTPLITALLEGSDTETDADFFVSRSYWESLADKIVYTGKLDEYYEYSQGILNYRTVEFRHKLLNISNYQGNAVVNYTDYEIPYTRVIEHKHFSSPPHKIDTIPDTVISEEYSCEWKMGMEPFYPINDSINTEIFLKYKRLAKKEHHVVFGGRLAEYQYYDMAPTVERAIQLFSKS